MLAADVAKMLLAELANDPAKSAPVEMRTAITVCESEVTVLDAFSYIFAVRMAYRGVIFKSYENKPDRHKN